MFGLRRMYASGGQLEAIKRNHLFVGGNLFLGGGEGKKNGLKFLLYDIRYI